MQQPQENSPHNRKGTPAKRRNRKHSLSQGRRIYASENDIPSDALGSVDLVNSVPLTPLKSAANSPAPTTSQPTNARPKARTASSKQRPKQVSTSPGTGKSGQTTPPSSAAPKFTEIAFAGATFHASPAPSSLPMPSFLSKSLDSPGVKENDRASQEPSPPVTDSEAPTPQRRTGVDRPGADDSPLDLLFRAQRAEQERARRASSATMMNVACAPFSPPLQTMSPQAPTTLPQNPRDRRPCSIQRSSSGISTQELDGTPGRPMGPAFSTPYNDRIRAMRPGEKTASSTRGSVQLSSDPADRSAELMTFLGIKPPMATVRDGPSSPVKPTSGLASHPVAPHAIAHASCVTVSTSSTTTLISGRSPEVDELEDNLRKALKLSTPSFAMVPATTSHQGS